MPIPETPYTRKEAYLNAIATGDSGSIPETPYTREEMYLDYIARNGGGGGGGGDITVESKSISSNGTYTAPSGKAYSPVTVNVPASAVDSGTKPITSNGNNQDVVGYAAVDVAVPNSYTAGDEGKVVSNGELVAQTAHAEVTANGTIDTTLNDSVVVNVPSGGGVSSKIATGTFSGNGAHYVAIPVGKKMPNTNFLFVLYADNGTEYTYDSDYKIANLTVVVIDTFVSYNLSTNGDKSPTYANNAYTWNVNNGGTITSVSSQALATVKEVRNATTNAGFAQSNRPSIIKNSTGFSISYNQGNASHKFVSGLTYKWGLYYFGSNPSSEIVEVE